MPTPFDDASVIFETPRLFARRIVAADAPALYAHFADPEMVRFLGSFRMASIDDAHAIVARAHAWYAATGGAQGSFIVIERASGQLVGTTLCKPAPDADWRPTDTIEVGWHTSRPHWGKGFAVEYGSAIVAYGRGTLGLPELVALVDPRNVASRKVAERIGLYHHGQTDRWYGETTELYTTRPLAGAA